MALKADTGAAKPGLLLLFLKSCSALTFRCPRWGGEGLEDIASTGFASMGRNFPAPSKVHRVMGYSRLEGVYRDH